MRIIKFYICLVALLALISNKQALADNPFVYVPKIIKGNVLDKETGKPIEGAYVVFTWDEITGTVGGAVHSGPIHAQEMITDKEGFFKTKLAIPKLSANPLSSLDFPMVIIYKDGYTIKEIRNLGANYGYSDPIVQQERSKFNNGIFKLEKHDGSVQAWFDNIRTAAFFLHEIEEKNLLKQTPKSADFFYKNYRLAEREYNRLKYNLPPAEEVSVVELSEKTFPEYIQKEKGKILILKFFKAYKRLRDTKECRIDSTQVKTLNSCEEIYRKYKAQNVQVISIAVAPISKIYPGNVYPWDRYYPEDIQDFANKHQISHPLFLMDEVIKAPYDFSRATHVIFDQDNQVVEKCLKHYNIVPHLEEQIALIASGKSKPLSEAWDAIENLYAEKLPKEKKDKEFLKINEGLLNEEEQQVKLNALSMLFNKRNIYSYYAESNDSELTNRLKEENNIPVYELLARHLAKEKDEKVINETLTILICNAKFNSKNLDLLKLLKNDIAKNYSYETKTKALAVMDVLFTNIPQEDALPLKLSKAEKEKIDKEYEEKTALIKQHREDYLQAKGESMPPDEAGYYDMKSGQLYKRIPHKTPWIKELMFMLDDKDERQIDLIFLGVTDTSAHSLMSIYPNQRILDFLAYKIGNFTSPKMLEKIAGEINKLLKSDIPRLQFKGIHLFKILKEIQVKKKLPYDLTALEKTALLTNKNLTQIDDKQLREEAERLLPKTEAYTKKVTYSAQYADLIPRNLEIEKEFYKYIDFLLVAKREKKHEAIHLLGRSIGDKKKFYLFIELILNETVDPQIREQLLTSLGAYSEKPHIALAYDKEIMREALLKIIFSETPSPLTYPKDGHCRIKAGALALFNKIDFPQEKVPQLIELINKDEIVETSTRHILWKHKENKELLPLFKKTLTTGSLEQQICMINILQRTEPEFLIKHLPSIWEKYVKVKLKTEAQAKKHIQLTDSIANFIKYADSLELIPLAVKFYYDLLKRNQDFKEIFEEKDMLKNIKNRFPHQKESILVFFKNAKLLKKADIKSEDLKKMQDLFLFIINNEKEPKHRQMAIDLLEKFGNPDHLAYLEDLYRKSLEKQ